MWESISLKLLFDEVESSRQLFERLKLLKELGIEEINLSENESISLSELTETAYKFNDLGYSPIEIYQLYVGYDYIG